jgi:hypothetical protein
MEALLSNSKNGISACEAAGGLDILLAFMRGAETKAGVASGTRCIEIMSNNIIEGAKGKKRV